MNTVKLLRGLIGAYAGLVLTTAAHAQVFGFDCITDNSATNCAIGEAQFSMTFSEGTLDGQSYFEFSFTNTGDQRLSLTDVYFDWGSPAPVSLGQAVIVESGGVNFSWGATPNNLPGGNSIGFTTSLDLSADSDAPVYANGVNATGEYVSFRFFSPYSETLSDLESGDLRIGVRGQGFEGGGSEGFVAVAAPVPEPGAVALMLAGLGVVGFAAKSRRRPTTFAA